MKPRTSAARADDDADESSVQRIVPATNAAPLKTNAPSSVFDVGRQARAAAKRPGLDPAAIVIRKGVPKPKSRIERGSIYLGTVKAMEPGDSVELPLRQAKSLYSRAKDHGSTCAPPQRFSFRTINATTGAVWRDA